MRRMWLVVTALIMQFNCLATLAVWAQEKEEPIQFSTVTLDELFGGTPLGMNDRYFPITVDIPTIYSIRHFPIMGEVLWSTQADVKRITEENQPLQENGFFTVKVSTNFGYDAKSNRFSDFQGTDERNLKAAITKLGMRVTELKRHNVKSFPVLIIEGDGLEGRKTRSAYVATKVDTNILFIYYVHRNPWSTWDNQVWTRFKATLLADK